MNKTEFKKVIYDLKKVTSFLQLKEHEPDKDIHRQYCYAIKVNYSCVGDTDDLWYDWLEFWSIDSFLNNHSHNYLRITQVTLLIFDPSELTNKKSIEGPLHDHIVYDIRNRLSDVYLGGLKSWPY